MPVGSDIVRTDEEESIGKQVQRRAAYGSVTVEAIETYLDTLRECGIIARAALAANLSYATVRNLRLRDPDFAAEEEQAKELFIAEKIDDPIRHFGLEGEQRIIIDKFGNRHVGERIVQPQLALAYARKFDPNYREKQEMDVKHSGGVVVVTAPTTLCDEDLEKYARKVESEKREIIDQEPAKGLPGSE